MRSLHSIPREGQTNKRGKRRRLPELTDEEKRTICMLLSRGLQVRLQWWQRPDYQAYNRIQYRAAPSYYAPRPRYRNVSRYMLRWVDENSNNLEPEDWDKIKVVWND